MIRLSVMYPAGPPFDWDYYLGPHVQLCHKLLDPLGLVKVEVDRGLGGFPPGTPAPFQAVGYLFFRTMEEFQSALMAAGPQLVADQRNYSDGQCTILVSEVV